MPATTVCFSLTNVRVEVVLGRRFMSLGQRIDFDPHVSGYLDGKIPIESPGYSDGDTTEFTVLSRIDGSYNATKQDVFAAIQNEDMRPANVVEYLWAIAALAAMDAHLPYAAAKLTALGTLFDSFIHGQTPDRYPYMVNSDLSHPRIRLVTRDNIGLHGMRSGQPLSYLAVPIGTPAPMLALDNSLRSVAA